MMMKGVIFVAVFFVCAAFISALHECDECFEFGNKDCAGVKMNCTGRCYTVIGPVINGTGFQATSTAKNCVPCNSIDDRAMNCRELNATVAKSGNFRMANCSDYMITYSGPACPVNNQTTAAPATTSKQTTTAGATTVVSNVFLACILGGFIRLLQL